MMFSDQAYGLQALVECEGESIDLSGDMGAVGRVIIAETPSKEPEMFLDLKGLWKSNKAILDYLYL